MTSRILFKDVPETTIKAYKNAARKQELSGKLTRLILQIPKHFVFEGDKESVCFAKVAECLDKQYGCMLCPWFWKKYTKEGKLESWGFDVLTEEEKEVI